MADNNQFGAVIPAALLLGGVLMAGAYFIPWNQSSWGYSQQVPGKTVTVVGEAQTQKANQTASYTAGVSAVNDDKQKAIDEVNGQINAIIASVKGMGIDDDDVKTQNLNVYQMEESYWEGDRQKSRKGQWRVDNSIEIKLKDATKAEELTKVLTDSGATNIYGPNYTYDDTENGVDTGLYNAAMENARAKAEALAQASGKRVGGVISVVEGVADSGVYPLLRMGGGGGAGGSGLEPGSTTVTTQLTVVFELR